MHNDYRNIVSAATRHGNKIPTPAAGSVGSTIHHKVVFSFEHYDRGYQCISTWTQDEAKTLLEMFHKASQLTWMEVFRTGGKSGSKVGLGWTDFKDNDPFVRPPNLSKDLSISEMRASKKLRVFGAKKDAVFYVLRLDRQHGVT